jgi:hypothetical protein
MKRIYAIRGTPMDVSQEWLDANRGSLANKWWRIDGDTGITIDAGDDGIPDSGWTKKDITAWLKGRGETVGGYATKSKLLGMVELILNPPAPEPVVEEPVVEEPVVEEPVVEEVAEETEITGDEE